MGIFHKMGEHYIHHGETKFDTGLPLELLQEFYLVALDVFRKIPYHRDRSESTAWLSLLTTEHLEDAEALVREYPWLEEIYEEAAMLRQRSEEVLGMFSEALQILDENTVKYMIEELQKKVEEKEAAINEKDTIINEQSSALHRISTENEALKRQLEELSQNTSL